MQIDALFRLKAMEKPVETSGRTFKLRLPPLHIQIVLLGSSTRL